LTRRRGDAELIDDALRRARGFLVVCEPRHEIGVRSGRELRVVGSKAIDDNRGMREYEPGPVRARLLRFNGC